MELDSKTDQKSDKLVVVGASAGGIEALSILVSTLPADFPAPLVLAQHLDPHRRSSLEQILQRRTPLPIVSVQDGPPTALQRGTVYVVPANRHVSIRANQVEIEGDHADRPRPSIDLLLSSAAAAYGENLIAVILTGSGSDGAAGAVDVSQAGGTVIIQNPRTAQFPAMPLALPPTAVDHIVDLEHIGPLLSDLLSGSVVVIPDEAAADPLRDILAQVGRQANIDFRQYKQATILRRIGRRMAITHMQTLGAYVEYVRQHPEEVAELVMTFLIKVTQFFRDPAAFEFLQSHVLPTVIERGRANGRTLRLWSAGCATGEEPYSLALLIADMLGPELPAWNVRIFATDLDGRAIEFARRGIYPANVLANLPHNYRTRFFESVDDNYRVSKVLRQMVIFGQQDLTRRVPFPRIDLACCRNVLIYFQPELQQSVVEMLAYSLHEIDGFLFLGQAETMRPSKANFDLISKKWKIYRCTRGPSARAQQTPAGAPAFLPADRRRHGAGAPVAGTVAAGEGDAGSVDVQQIRRLNESVMRFLPTAVIMIDRAYHILTINPAARRILAIREVGGDQDFLHSSRGLPYSQVRTAIDAAFRENLAVTLRDLELDGPAGTIRFLSLTVVPTQTEAGVAQIALINVEDVTEQNQIRRQLALIQQEQKQLVEELSEANRRFSELNKDLQHANEELQSANEEMMLTQEELQATNEEFEATNEELQATNEELETNNEEMQATNEELETTNEELTARTNELQDVARSLAGERVRLIEIVELAPFYILVLRGPTFIVEAFNPRYARLLAGREVLGQPLAEVFGTAQPGEIVSLVREAYRQNRICTTAPRAVSLPGDDGPDAERFFVYTVVPTHDGAGQVDGAVIYVEDVSEQLEHAAVDRRVQLQFMVERADQLSIGLYDGHTQALLQASPHYLEVLGRVHGRPPAALLGERWDAFPLLPAGHDGTLFDSVVASRTARRLADVHLLDGRQDGESIWDFSLIPIVFGGGAQPETVEFVALSAVEITAQIRAREELERVDRLKDEFLAMASHELRTPLVPLRGYADMLVRLLNRPDRGPDWEARLRRYIAQFDGQLHYLSRLINDLVDIGRLQSGKLALALAPVDLHALLSQVVEHCGMLSDAHKCRVGGSAESTAVLVAGDLQRLTQAVMNLVENAIKYAPVSTAIDLGLAVVDGQAALTVRDYGPGIPADEVPHLFERFYQAPQLQRPALGGLGLGLFIARQIVEQHGGSLTVDSTVGAGTTFTICLPLLPTATGG